MTATGLTETARWIVDEGERQGRQLLHALGQQGKVAAREGVEAMQNWRGRVTLLLERWADKHISTLDLTRALESEGEALSFTLAAVANEHARAVLATVLKDSLKFLGNVFGAALKAVS